MKQIRNGDLVGNLMDRGDSYFHWLQRTSGLYGPLSSLLAETEFISVDGLDDILVEKTKEEVRRKYAEEVCEDDEKVETVYKSVRGDVCLFEVILCLAFSINEMFEGCGSFDGPSHFFGKLMENAGFDKFDEEDYDMHPDIVKEYWEKHIKCVLLRQYTDTGACGGLFPLSNLELWSDNTVEFIDRRSVSLWQQMNDWVDLHTNEDGEWVE